MEKESWRDTIITVHTQVSASSVDFFAPSPKSSHDGSCLRDGPSAAGEAGGEKDS